MTLTVKPGREKYGHQWILNFGDYEMAAHMQPGVKTAEILFPPAWLDAIPNAASGVAMVRLRTWEKSEDNIFASVAKPLTVTVPAGAAPEIGAVSVAPLLTVDGVTYPEVAPGGYVQGKCGYSAAMTGAAGKYGASILAYSISGGGYSGSGASLKSGLLKAAGKQIITFKATDTRGLSAVKTVEIEVLPYSAPRVTELAAWRVNEDGAADGMGTLGKWRTGAVFSALGGRNVLTAKAYLKPMGGTEAELGMLAVDTQRFAVVAGRYGQYENCAGRDEAVCAAAGIDRRLRHGGAVDPAAVRELCDASERQGQRHLLRRSQHGGKRGRDRARV